jgi:hypothetical protein
MRAAPAAIALATGRGSTPKIFTNVHATPYCSSSIIFGVREPGSRLYGRD